MRDEVEDSRSMHDFENIRNCEEVVAKILELGLRKKRSRILKLLDLSLETVYKNVHLVAKLPGNGYGNLPNTLLCKLLDMCKRSDDRVENLNRNFDLCTLVVGFPNSSLQKLDILNMAKMNMNACKHIFRLALRNCPKLEHVSAPCPLMPTASKRKTLELAQTIAFSWKRLKTLNLVGFYATDTAIKFISKNLPNLQKINLSITTEKFSEVGTFYLLGMKKLADLELYFKNYVEEFYFFTRLMMAIGSKFPNLQRLHINNFVESRYVSTDFAMLLSICHPEIKRKMLLHQASVTELMLPQWPSNIHVDTLIVHPKPNNIQVNSHSCGIPCGVSELILLDPDDPDLLYKLLEKLGPKLKRLKISEYLGNVGFVLPGTLDLYKVVSLCPKLEHFSTNSTMQMAIVSTFNLKPEYFSNFKSFELEGENTIRSDDSLLPFISLFQMVLKGSKKYKILELQNAYLLRETATFLANNSDCLSQVEVFNAVVNRKELLTDICSIGKLLMIRSPFFRRIEIHGACWDSLPHWFLLMAYELGVQVECKSDFLYIGNMKLNPIHIFSTSNSDVFVSNKSPLISPFFQRFFPELVPYYKLLTYVGMSYEL
ncbi:uncharacterized protein LOC135934735 [Cloeon dipterum]|uniref:uncharacterized protein LOC135934735 n=1 Tax=Cloeon dipterum TaxID=197152 RepID=UPI0032202EB0